jgi:retron-type reverse transcriptase
MPIMLVATSGSNKSRRRRRFRQSRAAQNAVRYAFMNNAG